MPADDFFFLAKQRLTPDDNLTQSDFRVSMFRQLAFVVRYALFRAAPTGGRRDVQVQLDVLAGQGPSLSQRLLDSRRLNTFSGSPPERAEASRKSALVYGLCVFCGLWPCLFVCEGTPQRALLPTESTPNVDYPTEYVGYSTYVPIGDSECSQRMRASHDEKVN